MSQAHVNVNPAIPQWLDTALAEIDALRPHPSTVGAGEHGRSYAFGFEAARDATRLLVIRAYLGDPVSRQQADAHDSKVAA